MLRALYEEEFQESKPKYSKQSKFLSQGTTSEHFPKKPHFLLLDFVPDLIGLQSWEKLISSKCFAILKHRFVCKRNCMWLVLQGCSTQWLHEHFGEKTRNFIVSKIPVFPKSSYPLTNLWWSFLRNPIQLQMQFPIYESNLSETKVELISSGSYEKRERTFLEKSPVSKKLHFICCPNNHKFRCSEHDTEEWHSQAALTETQNTQFSKPLTVITSLTPILSRLPLHECSRAITSQGANTCMCWDPLDSITWGWYLCKEADILLNEWIKLMYENATGKRSRDTLCIQLCRTWKLRDWMAITEHLEVTGFVESCAKCCGTVEPLSQGDDACLIVSQGRIKQSLVSHVLTFPWLLNTLTCGFQGSHTPSTLHS